MTAFPTATTPVAVPSILLSGQQTQVTVTSFILGAIATTQVQLFNLAGGSSTLVGTMTDDGQNGDKVAGDHVYTIQTAMNAPAGSSLPMQVVATTGTNGTMSTSFSIPVVGIPTYTSNDDVNQAELQLFNTAVRTRSAFATPTWSDPKFLPGIASNLSSMFGELAGVVSQNPTLASAAFRPGVLPKSNSVAPRANGIVDSVLNILTFGLLSPAQNAQSCSELLDSLAGSPSHPYPVLSPADPQMQNFAAALTSACTTAPDCQGLFTQDDFLTNTADSYEAYLWAQSYIGGVHALTTPIAGCGGGVAQSLDDVAVKTEASQFTELSGEALTQLAGGGQIAQQASDIPTDIITGWVAGTGQNTIVIGQASGTETFAAPAGTYNLALSAGGSQPNTTISSVVYPNGITVWTDPQLGNTLVFIAPNITDVNPKSGPVGTPVVITGTAFGTDAPDTVAFNGTSATVTDVFDTQIETSVPPGATSGPIKVQTSGGSATSSVNFTVTPGSIGNPAPTITSLNPTSVSAGTQYLNLTVNGTGFIANSAVTFNGNGRAVEFVNATQLVVALTAADLSTSGSYPIVVTNPAPGGGPSNSATFVVSNSPVTISPISVSVPVNQVQTFTSLVSGGGGVTWSVQEGSSGGAVTNAGIYTAPATVGTFHVVATSTTNPSASASATVTVTPAVAYSIIATFSPLAGPNPLIQGTDGVLYGTAQGGGYYANFTSANCYNYGCGGVFSVTTLGGFTDLHDFAGADGGEPGIGESLVQGQDGGFYGTTSVGGSNQTCVFNGGITACGTVFRIDSAGGLTTLHSFSGQDGAFPVGGLVAGSDGSFYGTTSGGGDPASCTNYQTPGCGTLFKIDSTGNFTSLHLFEGTEGATPNAPLTRANDGYFYGTTSRGGGTAQAGTVFRMDSSGVVTLLHSFSGPPDGYIPNEGLIQASDGYLYGTTSDGGSSNLGTVFRIDSSGNLVTLHSFSGPDGSHPTGGLIQGTDGFLYGVTGPASTGTIFRTDLSGNVTILHSFTGADGQAPSGIMQAKDGSYYGGASEPAINGRSWGTGIIFKISF